MFMKVSWAGHITHVAETALKSVNKTYMTLSFKATREIKTFDWNVNVLAVFNVHGSVHRKYIPIYIQQDATLRSLLYLETALHVSDGTSTHHQERKQLYLQHLLFVTPLMLPAAIVIQLFYDSGRQH